MSLLYEHNGISLHCGDCLDVLKAMPECSVDACVCDPPYGLSREPDVAEVMRHWIAGDRYEHVAKSGFMGRSWDSFIPGPEYWREVFRVLKHGAHLLAFSSTRTWDLLSMAIRFAGFQMRDTVAVDGLLRWAYSQGFPKSVNVALDVKKATGDDGQAARFAGVGTALKPMFEPILVFRKPLDGTIANNVVKWGTGGLNIDACRVPYPSGEPESGWSQSGSDGTGGYRGEGTFRIREMSADEIRARVSAGRFPGNVLLCHLPTCEMIGKRRVKAPTINRWDDGMKPFGGGAGHPYTSEQTGDADGMQVVEEWACDEGCPVRAMDRQAGVTKSGTGTVKRSSADGYRPNTYGAESRPDGAPQIAYGDEGGASRFFGCFPPDAEPCFMYCPKPPKSERDEGCEELDAKSAVECVGRNPDSAGARNPRAGAGRTARKVLECTQNVLYAPASWVVEVLRRRLPADTVASLRKATVGSMIQSSDGGVWSMCWCGSPSTDPFHPAISSIIETETNSTIELKTWPSNPRSHTNGCMAAVFGVLASGGSLAASAASSSPWAKWIGTSTREGQPIPGVVNAIFVESWLRSVPEGGGGRGVEVHNFHPT